MTDKKISVVRQSVGQVTSAEHFDQYVDWINQNMTSFKAVVKKDENGRRYFDLVSK